MTSAEYQQLVESLERQFSAVGRQFSEVGRRFTEMDRRFDEVDLRVTGLRQDILGHFDGIYHRLERLEQEYHAITQLRRQGAKTPEREAVDAAASLRHLGTQPPPSRGGRSLWRGGRKE